MKKKHLVVQGAICKCNYGSTPDQLVVLTNQKEYVNDNSGSEKLIASTKDIGATFKIGSFGSCAKQNGSACKSVVLEWKYFYEKTTIYNGGKILLETSKATCPIGGSDCIGILKHGQQAEMSLSNFKKADPKVQKILNPLVNFDNIFNKTPEVY